MITETVRTEARTPFTKVCRVGTMRTPGGRAVSLYLEINYTETGRLAISGVEGPLWSGNCLGSAGQCRIDPGEILNYAPGWTEALYTRVLALWNEWHLNDMRPGTPAQMAIIRAHPRHVASYPGSFFYDAQCAVLAARGLLRDPALMRPYKRVYRHRAVHGMRSYTYGSEWLAVPVPASVLGELRALPDTDQRCPWYPHYSR